MISTPKKAKFLVMFTLKGADDEIRAEMFEDLMAAAQIYRALKAGILWKAMFEKRKDPNAWHLVEEEMKGEKDDR